MDGREYRYQKDWTIGNTMYHVRCDDWAEFTEAIKNIEALLPANPTNNASTAPTGPSGGTVEVCRTCGGPTLPEKRITGKDGRSWLIKDCSTGDRSHKGPIKPAP